MRPGGWTDKWYAPYGTNRWDSRTSGTSGTRRWDRQMVSVGLRWYSETGGTSGTIEVGQ